MVNHVLFKNREKFNTGKGVGTLPMANGSSWIFPSILSHNGLAVESSNGALCNLGLTLRQVSSGLTYLPNMKHTRFKEYGGQIWSPI